MRNPYCHANGSLRRLCRCRHLEQHLPAAAGALHMPLTVLRPLREFEYLRLACLGQHDGSTRGHFGCFSLEIDLDRRTLGIEDARFRVTFSGEEPRRLSRGNVECE